ncbi:MAG: serine/threonine-protein kinase [Mariprofundus sp.]
MTVGAFWKSDWFFTGCISLFFLLIHTLAPTQLLQVENFLFDSHARMQALPTDNDIVLIQPDQTSSRAEQIHQQTAIAQTINKLVGAGARQIGLDIIYSEAQTGSNRSALPDAVRSSGNTRLATELLPAGAPDALDSATREFIGHTAISHINHNNDNNRVPNAGQLLSPYAQLTQAAAGLGFRNILADNDGITRSQPLAMTYNGQLFPSIALSLAAGALHVSMHDIRINVGQSIELGPINIPINDQLQMLSAFHARPYQSYTLSAVRSGSVPASLFHNKIVLIGDKAPEQTIATPVSAHTSTVEFHAHILQSILHKEFITQPAWAPVAEVCLLLLVGLYLILALPRMPVLAGVLASTLLLSLIIAVSAYLLSQQSLWLQNLTAALLLLTGHAGLALKKYFPGIHKSGSGSKADMDKTNKMLGTSFHSQGMLDQAMEKYMACPMHEELASVMCELALAFERKREFDKAIRIYKHIATDLPDYRDLHNRITNAEHLKYAQPSEAKQTGMAALLSSGDNKPTLGRYQILSELGKGAMGTVFLGLDPKINRQVAIKAMALSAEFAETELAEVKASFFHEAQIAGMLNHPNIVTIFDAGDERDLAYIAMEFLDGITLERHTKPGNLLPLPSTLRIIAKIAEALHYAHNQGVIHRDIKPANIMILTNKTVKVTDFGIARITEASKSRDGMVLGTPSYMSPEQLSGKLLDGRSDLFSLGVMLYELLCGIRPFQAGSMSKLMLSISREPHADVRDHNPDVPACVATLIDQMLIKKAADRIKSAEEVHKQISRCLRELSPAGRSS